MFWHFDGLQSKSLPYKPARSSPTSWTGVQVIIAQSSGEHFCNHCIGGWTSRAGLAEHSSILLVRIMWIGVVSVYARRTATRWQKPPMF